MLNKTIFTEGLKLLSTMKKNNAIANMDMATLHVWYALLSDIDDDDFQRTCVYILQNNDWFPTVAEIRAIAHKFKSNSAGLATTPDEQWLIFTTAVASCPGWLRIQQTHHSGKHFFNDPITDAVSKTMLKEFAMSNPAEAGAWRARFINTYRSIAIRFDDAKQLQHINRVLHSITYKAIEDKPNE